MTKKSSLGNRGSMYCHFYQGEAPPIEWQHHFPSVSRARDFYNSRKALQAALKELSLDFSSLTMDQLEIKDHLHLALNPHIKASLSHTGNTAAALVTDLSQIQSVGIDIERCGRQIKEGVAGYIRHADDGPRELLALWVAKEACFKAASPIYQSQKTTPLVLKDFWVDGELFGLFHREQVIGRLTLNIESHFDEEFWVAKAWLE